MTTSHVTFAQHHGSTRRTSSNAGIAFHPFNVKVMKLALTERDALHADQLITWFIENKLGFHNVLNAHQIAQLVIMLNGVLHALQDFI